MELTGGCSSFSLPASGLALRFANTPSDPDPPPYTLPVVGVGAKTGKIVALRSMTGGRVSAADVDTRVVCPAGAVGCPRINRCLSSPSFSSSLSDPSASKVSARFWSTAVGWDSLARCREVGEEARDRKDGGGEVGTMGLWRVSSSFADTCRPSVSIIVIFVGGRPETIAWRGLAERYIPFHIVVNSSWSVRKDKEKQMMAETTRKESGYQEEGQKKK